MLDLGHDYYDLTLSFAPISPLRNLLRIQSRVVQGLFLVIEIISQSFPLRGFYWTGGPTGEEKRFQLRVSLTWDLRIGGYPRGLLPVDYP